MWPNKTDCEVYSPWPSCYSVPGAVVTVVVVFALIIWIVGGNLLVIASVLRERRLRSQQQNWLIVSLATADLLVGLLIMPLTLSYNIIGEWRLGLILCELWLALDVLFVTSSILNLCVISLDRYWSVTDPLKYPFQRSFGRMMRLVAVAWGLSFVICLPPLVGWRPKRQPRQCTLSTDLGYVLYSAFGSFYIPVFIIIVVYIRIFSITRQQSQQRLKETKRTAIALRQGSSAALRPPTLTKFHQNGASLKNGEGAESLRVDGRQTAALLERFDSTSEMPVNSELNDSEPSSPEASVHYTNSTFSSRSMSPTAEVQEVLRIQTELAKLFEQRMKSPALMRRRRKQLKKRERQATVLLGLILAAFIASWLPFFLLYLLGAIGYQAPDLLFDICFWLGYCNSGLNPVIYTIFNREFRWAFNRTVRKFLLCMPAPPPSRNRR